MKLIVGLGNPGVTYAHTRHNIGFKTVDQLVKVLQIEELRYKQDFEAEITRFEDTFIVKPQTFMNKSGWAVQRIAAFYKIETPDIYVIHDDLDLPLGNFKLQQGVGPKIHNGILSVEEVLGKKDFWRLRMGVDGRNGDRTIKGEDYVLAKFTSDEVLVLNTEIEGAVKQLLATLGKGLVS